MFILFVKLIFIYHLLNQGIYLFVRSISEKIPDISYLWYPIFYFLKKL